MKYKDMQARYSELTGKSSVGIRKAELSILLQEAVLAAKDELVEDKESSHVRVYRMRVTHSKGIAKYIGGRHYNYNFNDVFDFLPAHKGELLKTKRVEIIEV